jgi:hypothetical protein
LEFVNMMSFFDALSLGRSSTAEALGIFDGLDTVDKNFMLGSWMGESFPTEHPLDGLLEAYHWYGKRFKSLEDVHPLMFTSGSGRKYSVNPVWIIPVINMLCWKRIPKSKVVGRLFQMCVPMFSTKHGRARLRMSTYRGKVSATMIYDNLPINDVFHKVDSNTVFGVMDLKGLKKPFFFVLRREL